MLPQEHVLTAPKRQLAREQLEQDHTERVDIRPAISQMALSRRLLRRQIAGRAHHRPLHRLADFALVRLTDFARVSFRQAKVSNVWLIFGVDQDVLRLQVAMDNPLLVSVVSCLSDRRTKPCRVLKGESSTGEPFVEGEPIYKLTRDVELLSFSTHCVDCDDIGVP